MNAHAEQIIAAHVALWKVSHLKAKIDMHEFALHLDPTLVLGGCYYASPAFWTRPHMKSEHVTPQWRNGRRGSIVACELGFRCNEISYIEDFVFDRYLEQILSSNCRILVKIQNLHIHDGEPKTNSKGTNEPSERKIIAVMQKLMKRPGHNCWRRTVRSSHGHPAGEARHSSTTS